jgi:type I restriction enzyme M protein
LIKSYLQLRKLSGSEEREIIATIFNEIPGNRMKSPYNLKDVIEIIDEIDFNLTAPPLGPK